jgi:hypothetical protein
MTNHCYDKSSLMEFQASVLSLAAALDLSAPVGSQEVSTTALVEVARLRNWVDVAKDNPV